MVKVMNKTDYEVLLQYVEETDKEFYESLSTQKQIMYLCYQYGTESFKKYLFKYRFQQVCNKLKVNAADVQLKLIHVSAIGART